MIRVRLEKVSKRFGGSPAADIDELEIRAGDYHVLAGPSGSGKTTLLRLMAGLDAPDSGRILFDEADVTDWPPERRRVGLVFAEGGLLPHLTIAENAALPLRLAGVPRPEAQRRIAETTEFLGLGALLDRRPHDLSTGERQRAALARALVRRPALLLLDEPLAALDAPLRTRLRLELRRVHRELGLTVVHVTHDQSEALAAADRLSLLRAGRLAQSGRPEEIYRRPVTRWVAGFLGSPPMNFLRLKAPRDPARDRWELPAADGLASSLFPPPPAGPDSLKSHPEVAAGFRPEAAFTAPPDPSRGFASFTARFERAEFMGHASLWRLRRGEADIHLWRPASEAPPAPGESLRIDVPTDALLWFAADAPGARLA